MNRKKTATLVIVDVPTAERQDEEKTVVYSTMPMAIITNNRFITTVCLRENAVISELSQGLVKEYRTHLRTQFLLNICCAHRNAISCST